MSHIGGASKCIVSPWKHGAAGFLRSWLSESRTQVISRRLHVLRLPLRSAPPRPAPYRARGKGFPRRTGSDKNGFYARRIGEDTKGKTATICFELCGVDIRHGRTMGGRKLGRWKETRTADGQMPLVTLEQNGSQ